MHGLPTLSNAEVRQGYFLDPLLDTAEYVELEILGSGIEISVVESVVPNNTCRTVCVDISRLKQCWGLFCFLGHAVLFGFFLLFSLFLSVHAEHVSADLLV